MRLQSDGRLQVGEHTAQLTPTEVRAIRYLLAHAGQVVKRTTLEREVWGFAPGVVSEAVPVALRGLRAKLGPHRSLLQTLRGIGWRLQLPTPVRPRVHTPWTPRPKLTERTARLLADGWRCITLVGPGGAGKSRLADHIVRDRDEVVWVDVPPGASAERLERALLAPLGLLDGSLETAGPVLATTWVVLDGAENSVEAVQQLLPELGGATVLVTSRCALQVPGEALVEVAGLSKDAAERFLQSRLAASRGAFEPPEPLIGRAIEVLDALPLALEVAASHPLGLLHVVESLERDELPEGLQRWFAALASSIDRLETPTREVLDALCAADGPLPEAAIERWLGPDAGPRVRALANQSLVQREDDRWRVLETVRTFRRASGEVGVHAASFDRWLLTYAVELFEELRMDPASALRSWRPLEHALYAAVSRVPVREVEALVAHLYALYGAFGPLSSQRTLVLAGLERCPNSVWLRVLRAPTANDPDALDIGWDHPDSRVRLATAWAHSQLRPATLTAKRLSSLAEELEPWDALGLQVAAIVVALRTASDDGWLELAEACVEQARPWPLVWIQQRMRLGVVCFRLEQFGRAALLLEGAEQTAVSGGLTLLALHIQRLQGLICVHTQRDELPLVAVAENLNRAGLVQAAAESWVYAGLAAVAKGRTTEAGAYLKARGASPTLERLGDGLRLLCAASDGDDVAYATLEGWSEHTLRDVGEGAEASRFFVLYLQGVAAAWRSDDPATALAALVQRLPEASDPEARLLVAGLLHQLG